MTRWWISGLVLLLLVSCLGSPVLPEEEKAPATISEITAGLSRVSGFLTLYLDKDQGKIWLELPAANPDTGVVSELLYVEGLTTGLGSNPVGLDRGQLGKTRLLSVRRVGGKIFFEEPNLRYRALSDRPEEVRAARDSFATSVLWGAPIRARGESGELLIELTSFLVRDAHGISNKLKSLGEGTYSIDDSRSGVDFSGCHVFPHNVELEALLTYAGKDPGSNLRSTSPDPRAVSFTQHHSLIRLPDRDYHPRRFDPRAGSFGVSFLDYGAPLDAPIEKSYVVRMRLKKVNEGAAPSRVLKPIVYYVDPGAPEPVRSALLEGARWWSRAFEAAGFIDAFQVKVLPANAHPLDVRYNVIQWVHRSTRGWSYGGGVVDPRTGEQIKGHVSLGSLRVRQDRKIFEGLSGTDLTGTGEAGDPVELALARIRQLAAHEVGHTLGFNHNFAASTYGDRASVMDYPAPRVGLSEKGELDFSSVYGVGVGAWDVFSVRYAYSEFAPGVEEAPALLKLIQEGIDEGLVFLTDADARPMGSCHPLASLWDNGSDPVEELAHCLKVREVALARFGERCIQKGEPLATLQEILAPVYFYHRYQVEAAAKVIGGMSYSYTLRGDGQQQAIPVSGEAQRRGLEVLLDCVEAKALDLPESILTLLVPRPSGSSRNREMFASSTAPGFDSLGAATTAADLVFRFLLHPDRCGRLVDFHRRDGKFLGLSEMLQRTIERTFVAGQQTPRLQEIAFEVQGVLLHRLLDLAIDPSASPGVRMRVEESIRMLRKRLERFPVTSPEGRFHVTFTQARIHRFFSREMGGVKPGRGPAGLPPGSPIGSDFSGFVLPEWASTCGSNDFSSAGRVNGGRK